PFTCHRTGAGPLHPGRTSSRDPQRGISRPSRPRRSLMARRQYGEGNISSYTTKAGVRYRARWYEPVGPGSHEQVRRTKAGFLTKKEAAAYIRNRLTDVERGQATPFAPTATVQQFLDEWLESHRAGPSTMSGYRRIARLYVVPHIGSRELRALTPDVLARMYRKLE